MEIDCFLYPGWRPLIRPAAKRREWMDETPESFAYRCLPLSIANCHGWEIGSPLGFSAIWHGGTDTDSVEISLDDDGAAELDRPVSLFGQGTITFHVAGLFRTSPGWNLWVGGPSNAAKDGIAPLAGIIETDWSPYTFTMNWRFTRPGHRVRFEPGEPIAFFFPVERGTIEAASPRFRPIEEAPELQRQFDEWSRSRSAFQQHVREHPPSAAADKWQKLYYRGVAPDGCPGSAGHQSKLRAPSFAPPLQTPWPRPSAKSDGERRDPPAPQSNPDPLAKRDWLLVMQEQLRALSPRANDIYRYDDIDPEAFLDDHYALNRPAILCGEIDDWPALKRWSPAYLARQVGAAPVEYQGERTGNARFELEKDRHRRSQPFSDFIKAIAQPGNDAYLTAYNSGANAIALAPLRDDLGRIDKLLAHGDAADEGMLWIGPAGTFTPLHHDLTNNLLVQITGRKRVLLVPASETPLLQNHVHVFSEIGDLLDPEAARRFPEIARVRVFDVELQPGEILFLPIGWWHQVTALDFSVSATYTNFRWRNDWHQSFPTVAARG
ncbi:MAG: cupin-like domain-containing protein [Sphingomonadaceae bacterium]|nr:cupin-like domain-containing protein [Sphingomonadaceae bacterium]